MRHEGFHGRAGFGRRPALVVVDVNRGFTDPGSPLVCELDGVVEAIRRLIDGFRAAGHPVVFTTVAYDDAAKQAAAAFIAKVPALLTLEAGSPWTEIDPRLAPLADEPVLPRDTAREPPHRPCVRLARGHRRLDVGVHPRDRGGRPPARVPRARPP
jgi:maleamate amidohydrolase